MSEYLQNAAYLVAHLVAVYGGRGVGVMYYFCIISFIFNRFLSRSTYTTLHGALNESSESPELGGGLGGVAAPCLFVGGARGAKVPFKYREYYIRH